MLTQQADTTAASKRLDLRLYVRQQPVMLALLAGLGVVSFLAVSGLSSAYHGQRQALGNRWFSRGVADLKAQRYDSAMTEFRAALLYSPDDDDYQLNLAEALIGKKRTAEAYSYLANLWERQPENGVVNLELARIAAQRNQTDQAQRYYHNAIYATWPSDQEGRRRDTRLELIEYLLSIHATAQAQAELIALEENLGVDAAQQRHIGDLFLAAQDYGHALSSYRLSLKSNRHDPAALAGAGWAAFQLGQYAEAQHYLQAAVTGNPDDAQSAGRLNLTGMVLRLDPYRTRINGAERNRIVTEAFGIAGQRLSSCATTKPYVSPANASSVPSLADNYAKMKPQISEQGLRRNPDLADTAMNLVFEIERQTSATCGTPTGADLALLLIAKLHEGTS